MSNAEEKREQRLRLLDDHIGRALAESEKSGELRSARNFGKPLDLGDGYDQTPADLRMGYKILKDAGVVPAEVELMRNIEALPAPVGDAAATRAAAGKAAHQRQPVAPRTYTSGWLSCSAAIALCRAGRCSMRCRKGPMCGYSRAGRSLKPRVQRLNIQA